MNVSEPTQSSFADTEGMREEQVSHEEVKRFKAPPGSALEGES